MAGILYLIDSLHVGGTEKQLVKLIAGLDRRRFQPHLCTLKGTGGLLADIDVPQMFLPFESFTKPTLFPALKKLANYVRNHDIRIIQTFFQDPFLIAALTRPFFDARLIGSFRDMGFWRTPAESRKMRLAYHFFTGFIANSQAVKDHFVQIDGLNAEKIRVIYNGIEKDGGENSLKGKDPVVGIVANCNRTVKRVDDFVRVAAIVHQRLPKVRFVVVGDGNQRAQLEQMSQAMGLAEVMTFAGSVACPMDYVRGFDVGVNVSETEGFCNAILEYMACGVPVVATAAGGNPELVVDGENGYLVPVGDIACIAERIIQLVENTEIRAQFGSKNAEKVSDVFSMQRMIDQHQDYYNEIWHSNR